MGPHLRDVYKRLFWQNSPLIRKYERKTKSKKNKIAPLKSNNLDDQLSHHIALKTDDQLVDYFINGGEVEDEWINNCPIFFCNYSWSKMLIA